MSRAAGAVQFQLRATPDGNLLVGFSHLAFASQKAVNGPIAQQLVEGKLTAQILYEANWLNNAAYRGAI